MKGYGYLCELSEFEVGGWAHINIGTFGTSYECKMDEWVYNINGCISSNMRRIYVKGNQNDLCKNSRETQIFEESYKQ